MLGAASRILSGKALSYTTILWDLDGTIIDSSPGIYASFIHTFETVGLAVPSIAQMREFIGPPLRETFERIAEGDQDLTNRLVEVYREVYLRGGGALNATAFPGVLELIAESKRQGRFNSMATSKGFSGVKIIGDQLGFLDLFDVLGTASNDGTRVAKADVITYALAELELIDADLSRVVLVGDRIHDVEGARHHGIDVVLVKWGAGEPDEWAQADAVVETPEELAEFLGLSA